MGWRGSGLLVLLAASLAYEKVVCSSVFTICPTLEAEDGSISLACTNRGEADIPAPFRALPVETRLPDSLDTNRPVARLGAAALVFCLTPGASMPTPVVAPRYRLGLESSIADNGLVLDGVPVVLLPGVEGDSPPIRDIRAPDRGVTFPLSVEVVGDRKSSFRLVGGAAGSDRRARRGGLVGDAFCEPANLGVKGLFVLRSAVLKVGVKGLAGVPLFCLSRDIVEDIVEDTVSRVGAGWAERSRIMTFFVASLEQCHGCRHQPVLTLTTVRKGSCRVIDIMLSVALPVYGVSTS